MGVTTTIEEIARGVEGLGIVTLVSGLVIALVRAANILIHSRSGEGAYRTVRTVFGRSILLGLEFLVRFAAASSGWDVIHRSPSWSSQPHALGS